ncbi:MAG: hypothetical protein ACRDHD_07610 [Candidatus Limnocylindria bacterium]
MSAQLLADRTDRTDAPDYETVVSTVLIAALALATAAIHASLGGFLFVLNGTGYAVLACALLLPVPLLARGRWLVRLALLGFTLATIGAWILFGARFPLAYLNKAIELGLVVVLAIEIGRLDRGIFGLLGRAIAILRLVRSPRQGPRHGPRPQSAG